MDKSPNNSESDQQLAADYMVWLVQLTVMTIIGSIGAAILLYFMFPDWVDKVYF